MFKFLVRGWVGRERARGTSPASPLLAATFNAGSVAAAQQRGTAESSSWKTSASQYASTLQAGLPHPHPPATAQLRGSRRAAYEGTNGGVRTQCSSDGR